ncbi:MAG: hypothetical protein CMO80_13965 [Verrucomicrobiales bacterium]|nr:hypothetical protein [Verrucomicrobiales bacterium]|tara:strand:+ start:152 stop:409 length:258 start_codon:yes stop_codon:yes gene_type:complete
MASFWNSTATWVNSLPDGLTIDLDKHQLHEVKAWAESEEPSFLGHGQVQQDYTTGIEFPTIGIRLDNSEGHCYSVIVALKYCVTT